MARTGTELGETLDPLLDLATMKEVRDSFCDAILEELDSGLELYSRNTHNIDPPNLGLQVAHLVEKLLLFGIVDVSKAWKVCEYMIKSHSEFFAVHYSLMQSVGLPQTNMGRFRCFLRLILIENQFLQYWRSLPTHKNFIKQNYTQWSIVRNRDYHSCVIKLFGTYSDDLYIQIPIDFEKLDEFSYEFDSFGIMHACESKEKPSKSKLDNMELEMSNDKQPHSAVIPDRKGKKKHKKKKHKNKNKDSTKSKKSKSKNKTKKKSKGDNNSNNNNNNNNNKKKNEIDDTTSMDSYKLSIDTTQSHSSDDTYVFSASDNDNKNDNNRGKHQKYSSNSSNNGMTGYGDLLAQSVEVDSGSFKSTDSSVITAPQSAYDLADSTSVRNQVQSFKGGPNHSRHGTYSSQASNQSNHSSNNNNNNNNSNNTNNSNNNNNSSNKMKSPMAMANEIENKVKEKHDSHNRGKHKKQETLDDDEILFVNSDVMDQSQQVGDMARRFTTTETRMKTPRSDDDYQGDNIFDDTQSGGGKKQVTFPEMPQLAASSESSDSDVYDDPKSSKEKKVKKDNGKLEINSGKKTSYLNKQNTLMQLDAALTGGLGSEASSDDDMYNEPKSKPNSTKSKSSKSSKNGVNKSGSDGLVDSSSDSEDSKERDFYDPLGKPRPTALTNENVFYPRSNNNNGRESSSAINKKDTLNELNGTSGNSSYNNNQNSILNDVNGNANSLLADLNPADGSSLSMMSNLAIKENQWVSWESQRGLLKNCWFDPLVHDEITDSLIIKSRPQLLPKAAKVKFDQCKETAIKSYVGTMWKKARSHQRWKQRYFELDFSKDFRMRYWTDKSKSDLKGDIDLSNIYMVSTQSVSVGRKVWIQLTLWDSDRDWILATENDSEAGYWVGVIDNAMTQSTEDKRDELADENHVNTFDKNVVIKGWCQKSNPRGKGFKPRWWYLNTEIEGPNAKLRYYEKDMSSKIAKKNKIVKGFKGEIEVSKALHVGPCIEKEIYQEFPLCIDIVMKERTYRLVPPRLEAMEQWIEALRLLTPQSDKKADFGTVHSGLIWRRVSKSHPGQLVGPASTGRWVQCYGVLSRRGMYYFKSLESYQLYRRQALIVKGSKVPFGIDEGVYTFQPGLIFYQLKGEFDGTRNHCFALVSELKGKKRKVMVFQANSKADLDQWARYFILCGIEDKVLPAVNAVVF